MILDKKNRRVNFLCKTQRLTRLNKHDNKISFLLDLFNAGYKHAYLSVMNCLSEQNYDYYRIEIVLPNVGRLCLHQSFKDILDEQIPYVEVFCSSADETIINEKIENMDLLKRATKIVYTARDYFERHPEYIVADKNLMKTIKGNQELLQKQQEIISKKRMGILRNFASFIK